VKLLAHILLCAVLGTAGYAVGMYRTQSQLLPRLECMYHTGYDEGFRDAAAQPLHAEEDEPGWDCRTMGNHKCGTKPAPITDRQARMLANTLTAR